MNYDITNLLAPITLIGDILIVIFLIFYAISFRRSNKILNYIRKNGLIIAFIAALASVAGSLYYSEILHYAPCRLCWFQRIFMYPQVLLLGIALWKQDIKIKIYSVSLAVIGLGYGIYHFFTQRFPEWFTPGCSEGEVSCSFQYSFEYGYITIPVMAITAFLYIIVFTLIWKKEDNDNNIRDKESGQDI